MILPKERDPRLVTLRRGGTLSGEDHRALALWAADCAQHVLPLYAADGRDAGPRRAIEAARAWARGEMPWQEARKVAFEANAAARPLKGAARFAAYAAGQAAAVGHVPEHYLGAAAYAIKAVQAAAPAGEAQAAGRAEGAWQRARIPAHLRLLVLEDQARRNPICWNVFEP